MGTFGNSWKLTKMSISVIRKDKELLLLPIISATAMVLLILSIILPLSYFGMVESNAGYAIYFGLYFALAFISIYFNVAIIAIATIRLKGGDPTLKDGIRTANRNLGSIAKWAVISATVGLLLRILRNYLQREAGILGSIFAFVAETAWALMTFFILPVLIFEDQPMIASIKRSGSLFKKTWGETMVAGFVLMLVFLAFTLLCIIPIAVGAYLLFVVGSFFLGMTLIVIGVCALVIVISMNFAAQGVLTAALYIYATEGKIPEDFSGASFN